MSIFTNRIEQWFTHVNWAGILIALVVGLIAYKMTSRSVQFIIRHATHKIPHETKLQLSERKKRLRTIGGLFAMVIKVIIALTVTYTILKEFGINLAPILASAGILGVALGFGAQSIVKDCLAGFFIVLENQYRVGDYVIIHSTGSTNCEGTVTAISLRRTALRDHGGNFHFIPNGGIIEVTNRTMGYSQFRFVFAVQSNTNVDDIVDIVNRVGREMANDAKWGKDIVDPPHYDEFGEIGANGMNVKAVGTCMPGQQWRVCAEFKKRLIVELQKSDVIIADVN